MIIRPNSFSVLFIFKVSTFMDNGTLCDIQTQQGAYRCLWTRIFKSCETWRHATSKWLQRSGNRLCYRHIQSLGIVRNSSKTWVTIYQSSECHITKDSENLTSRILFTVRSSFRSCNIKLDARRNSWRHSFLFFRKENVAKIGVYLTTFTTHLVQDTNQSDNNIASTK